MKKSKSYKERFNDLLSLDVYLSEIRNDTQKIYVKNYDTDAILFQVKLKKQQACCAIGIIHELYVYRSMKSHPNCQRAISLFLDYIVSNIKRIRRYAANEDIRDTCPNAFSSLMLTDVEDSPYIQAVVKKKYWKTISVIENMKTERIVYLCERKFDMI